MTMKRYAVPRKSLYLTFNYDTETVDMVLASDHKAEVEKWRNKVDKLAAIIRNVHGHLLDDRINAALKENATCTYPT